MKRRFLALILCLMMTAVMAGSAFAQETSEGTEEGELYVSYVNPLYEDDFSETETEEITVESDTVLAASSYYSSVSEAAEYVREQMTQRNTSISFAITTSEEPTSDFLLEPFYEALEHTGVPDEGDYLAWQYGNVYASASYRVSGGTYYLTVTYTVTYYTTLAQEQAVDYAVEAVLEELDLDGLDNYEKICAIYDYICENVEYDYENLNDSSYMLKHTAYAALINGTSVCQGYALLFYRLALEEGIDARIVTGTANSGDHGWNIVELGGAYYYLDCTWDAGKDSYTYFLLGSTNFLADHAVGEESEDIVSSYAISASDFDPDTYTGEDDEDEELQNGLCKDSATGTWYYYTDGEIDTSYTGLAKNDYGWWYVSGGKLDLTYTGMAKNDYGWWYVTNGKLDLTYTGMAKNAYGWWYMTDGKLDLTYTGMAKNDYGWWYMTDGKLDLTYTGMAKNDYGWWYMTDGKLDLTYTGMAKNDYGWWYVSNGKLDTSYTGLASNDYGTWYMVNGQLTYYTGTVTIGGVTYTIKNGMVVS